MKLDALRARYLAVFYICILSLGTGCSVKKLYEQVKTSPSITGFENFIALYPKSKFADSASIALVKLYEDRDWKTAQSYNTIYRYKEFALKYPHGDHVKEARTIISQKEQQQNPYFKQDDYAKNVPPEYEAGVKELVNYLMIPAMNDLEKVRLIYSWIAYHIKYDADAYNTGHYGDLTPEGVLKSKISVCFGYSSLFQAMAVTAGLEGRQISGFAKGYGYQTGRGFPKEPNHAWNAVKINGVWKLFDVTWGSGYGQDQNGALVSYARFDDYWFDTDPAEFIFNHYPENTDNQFIIPKIDLLQFQALPNIHGSFFTLGFSGDSALVLIRNNHIKEFADPYSIDQKVKIISTPYPKNLNSNELIEFVIATEYAGDISVINNAEWTHFEQNGSTFSLRIKPRAGKLSLAAKFDPRTKTYETFLQYNIIANEE